MTIRTLAAVVLVVMCGRAAASHCHEVSDVVGLERCKSFGEWSRDLDASRVWGELGFYMHSYQSPPLILGGPSRAMTGRESNASTAYGPAMRVLGGIGHVLYAGGELELGNLSTMPTSLDAAAYAPFDLGMLAVFGAHVEVLHVGFSGELASGFRYDDFLCADKPNNDACVTPSNGSQSRRELQLRARIDLFVHPKGSIGVAFGKSLIEDRNSFFAISIGIHSHPFDGM